MNQPPARSGPRTVWIILGILGLLVTCCCGGGILLGFLGYRKGTDADKEAKVFAKTAVEAIGKGWSTEEFKHYGSPALLPLIDNEKGSLYRAAWKKKLGNLKTLGEFSTQGLYFGSQNGLPPATRVRLTAPATFEKGTGTILVGVAKADSQWGIENIDIQSNALLK